MTTETHGTLYDADDDDPIGPATQAQRAASDSAGDTGIILVDKDGDVIDASQCTDPWLQPVRRVYVD